MNICVINGDYLILNRQINKKTQMKNTNTTDYLVKVQEVLSSKPANLHSEIINLSKHYAGDENRFVRQEIIADLIEIKHPLVKCGIGYLAEFTMTYLKKLETEVKAAKVIAIEPDGIAGIDYPMEAESKITVSPDVKPIKASIGLSVVRKQCQRKGEVTAIEGQHVTVTLEDGSKRKPCMSRFEKLYIQA
jgi:hypothetical protein